MQQTSDVLGRLHYLTGNAETISHMEEIPAKEPFNDIVIDFLNDVSRLLMANPAAKEYSDVISLAFWIRKSSMLALKGRFKDNALRLGRGVVFHIAPSNVPVNFAYSLVAGLLTGNANIIRVPSKEFPQVSLIVEAFNTVLKESQTMSPYLCSIRYGRDREINDALSSIADVRVIWGGDATISELRQSPLAPRATEVTFADRYSLAFIDSNQYMEIEDKDRVARDFYNDTFFSDQNACSSPSLIVWSGSRIQEAKDEFWRREYELVKRKYAFQSIQGVNKLASAQRLAAIKPGIKVSKHDDNLIVRVTVPQISNDLMDFKDNSGYFLEYDCEDVLELKGLCDKKCQTIAYIGNKEALRPLIEAGVKGIDHIVPIGRTMDFDLIWDGYNLVERLTRIIIFHDKCRAENASKISV